jgi:hypothetical protein
MGKPVPSHSLDTTLTFGGGLWHSHSWLCSLKSSSTPHSEESLCHWYRIANVSQNEHLRKTGEGVPRMSQQISVVKNGAPNARLSEREHCSRAEEVARVGVQKAEASYDRWSSAGNFPR